jgi:hypothetical protein
MEEKNVFSCPLCTTVGPAVINTHTLYNMVLRVEVRSHLGTSLEAGTQKSWFNLNKAARLTWGRAPIGDF